MAIITTQSIPPTWRKPAITIPRSESIQRSAAAIDVYRATIPAPGESESNTLHSIAQMCIEMADFDLLTNQEKYKQVLKSYIPATERTRPGFAFKIVRGGINFGNAAARAYEAYKDEDFLDYAVKAWNSGRNYTLGRVGLHRWQEGHLSSMDLMTLGWYSWATGINDIVVGGSSNSQWHNSGGILMTAATDVSGIYVPRGLLQTYNTTSDPTVRNYISAYLSTQYNAVIDLASGPGDTYALSWTGPA
ncbi:hypothetical protein MPER_11076, partial [Moniliophthora perniciosa FA553]